MYTKIKDLREDHDLKQAEISQQIHMNVTTYQRYERGEREIPLNIAILLADYYKVSLDYIAGRTKNKTGIGAKSQEAMTREEEKIIEAYRQMTEKGKVRLQERAESILENEAEESAMTRGRKSS